MINDKAILIGKIVKPVSDILEWAKWYETAERHVGQESRDGVRVSTVFLGMNHAFMPGPPLWFETMIFGGPHDGYQERYSTYREAEEGHAAALKLAFEHKSGDER